MSENKPPLDNMDDVLPSDGDASASSRGNVKTSIPRASRARRARKLAERGKTQRQDRTLLPDAPIAVTETTGAALMDVSRALHGETADNSTHDLTAYDEAALTPMPATSAQAGAGAIHIHNNSIASIAEEEARRRTSLWISLGVVVLAPVMAAILWFGVIASDIFASHASFVVRGPSAPGAVNPAEGLPVLLPNAGGAGLEDAQIVEGFINSRDMMQQLQSRLDLRGLWSDAKLDSIARLPANASDEQLYDMYRDRVQVSITPASGLTQLEVLSPSPDEARAINAGIIDIAASFVADLSQRRQSDALSATATQLADAEARLKAVQTQINGYRQDQKSVDTQGEITASLTLIANLEGQLAAKETELRQILAWMQPTSPRAVTLQESIDALKAQIDKERAEITTQRENGASMSEQLGELEKLQLEQQLAQQRYAAALTAHQKSLSQARLHQLALETVAAPSYPDSAAYPRRGFAIATTAAIALMIWVLGALLVASIREHARV